jgi:endo-1,4-beta-D-glucanase Y
MDARQSCPGNLHDHLPAWLWGQKDKENWAIIDTNSASDADIWIAWSLLEAGRLWKHPDYTRTGKALLKRIVSEEVVKVPGLGSMLLPGKVGFAEAHVWRFNPSYLPLSWRAISRVLVPRGPRFVKRTCAYCWRLRRKVFPRTGCNIRKTEAGS